MYEQPYWIAGLTVPDVVNHLSRRGFSCEGPAPRGETMHSWECMAPSNAEGVQREVSIVGRNPEGVRSVTATVSGAEGGMPPEQAAADFLGFVAALPYEGAEPARARQWVVENISSGGKLTMGNANLELLSEGRARVLRIVSTES
jgi:hypothetical protein